MDFLKTLNEGELKTAMKEMKLLTDDLSLKLIKKVVEG